MSLKEIVYLECQRLIHEKIHTLQLSLDDLTEGASNDSKSSAGDKHETARAMMQIEHERLSKQLADWNAMLHTLHKIDPMNRPGTIGQGSLIGTSAGYFFLAVPLGKIIADGTPVVVLSPQSPLGTKFPGLREGDIARMNSAAYIVESVE